MGGFQGRSENKNWKCLHKLISSEMHSCVGMRPWIICGNLITLFWICIFLKSSNLWISHVVSSKPSIFLHPNVFGIVKLPKYTALFKSDGDNTMKLKSVLIKGLHQSRIVHYTGFSWILSSVHPRGPSPPPVDIVIAIRMYNLQKRRVVKMWPCY